MRPAEDFHEQAGHGDRGATRVDGVSDHPLAIDLFTGLHGWSEGLVTEGYRVVGFDIEDMCGQFDQSRPEHVSLVLQDVLTLHGSQFKDAALIVASPPCQEYSYMAMPWTRAKQIAAALRGNGEFPDGYKGSRTVKELNALFNACFRIQREACEAAGRHIPLVVENVKDAQPWVSRARWSYGSFFLWGDVPALMPQTMRVPMKHGVAHRSNGATNFHGHSGGNDGSKNNGGSWFNVAHNTTSGHAKNQVQELAGIKSEGLNWGRYGEPDYKPKGFNVTNAQRVRAEEGKKCGGGWFGSDNPSLMRQHSSKSDSRKFASAMIAKIPLPLSCHIAATYYPKAR